MDYKNIKTTAYAILGMLFFIVIISTFSVKHKVVQNLSFREKTNLNSNRLVEGFGGFNQRKLKDDDDIFELIDRKLKGLTQELGGNKGKKEVKDILVNTKKICDLECAKCMMNMMQENKGVKSIDLDKLAEDDSSEYYVKYKKYTALSTSIKSMIDNL